MGVMSFSSDLGMALAAYMVSKLFHKVADEGYEEEKQNAQKQLK